MTTLSYKLNGFYTKFLDLNMILKAQETALCLIRKWWRPITCLGIAGTLIINGMIIPWFSWQVPDMTALAAYVAAATAAFAVREWGIIEQAKITNGEETPIISTEEETPS